MWKRFMPAAQTCNMSSYKWTNKNTVDAIQYNVSDFRLFVHEINVFISQATWVVNRETGHNSIVIFLLSHLLSVFILFRILFCGLFCPLSDNTHKVLIFSATHCILCYKKVLFSELGARRIDLWPNINTMEMSSINYIWIWTKKNPH